MIADPEDSPETTAARRDVLDSWGGGIRERLRLAEVKESLRLAEIATVPAESRRIPWPGPGPSGPLLHLNRPSVSRSAGNQQSAQARKVWKTGVLEMPKDAPPVRHKRSLVVKLADQIRENMKRENPK
jgi:hypothetical protein